MKYSIAQKVGGAKIVNGEKIIMMQQRSSDQRSTVDSRRRLTNFKMLVSQSMSAVLRPSV